jgi:hypothetical protein
VIIRWIEAKKPGVLSRVGDELRVSHTDGDVSSLWRREDRTRVPIELQHVRDLYEELDGADLFSSAFKIAAISGRRTREGVVIAPSLADLQEEAEQLDCQFPEGATPFMLQAGIGLYAVARSQALIYEWDTDQGVIANTYEHVEEILDEWLSAVG